MSLDRNPFHRSSTPMPLSARGVPKRYSARQGWSTLSAPAESVPNTSSWVDRLKQTVWDRTTGWAKRRLDDWMHRQMDQLLPEPLPPSIASCPPPQPSNKTKTNTRSTHPHLTSNLKQHVEFSNTQPECFEAIETSPMSAKRRRTRLPATPMLSPPSQTFPVDLTMSGTFDVSEMAPHACVAGDRDQRLPTEYHGRQDHASCSTSSSTVMRMDG